VKGNLTKKSKIHRKNVLKYLILILRNNNIWHLFLQVKDLSRSLPQNLNFLIHASLQLNWVNPWSTTKGWKDKGISKSEFVTKTPFLLHLSFQNMDYFWFKSEPPPPPPPHPTHMLSSSINTTVYSIWQRWFVSETRLFRKPTQFTFFLSASDLFNLMDLKQGIGIKGKEMALVWHEKASRTALQTSSVKLTHTLLVHTIWLQSRKLQNNVVNYN